MEGIVEQQLKKLHELYEKAKNAAQFLSSRCGYIRSIKGFTELEEKLDYVNELGALY